MLLMFAPSREVCAWLLGYTVTIGVIAATGWSWLPLLLIVVGAMCAWRLHGQ